MNKINNEKEKEKEMEKEYRKEHSNKIFIIAVITAFLIFLTYIFVSQFIFHKEKNNVNSIIELEENIV